MGTFCKNKQKTHKNLSDLAARLAVIDAANAKIGELTGQVTQLHNILAIKQTEAHLARCSWKIWCEMCSAKCL